ncbi:MAG: hypothetical protein J6Q62_02350 [Alistipes sp.]|jgi:hypothetical protein|nr:hypothetical protein [Alistipes sp.]
MSFFRPHKRHPRQFNYVPRYFNPVKEERDRRRRELHGTSSETDNEEYIPGKYIRTQREARDASRGESNPMAGVVQYLVIALVLGFAMLIFLPRLMRFVERANEEKLAAQQTSEVESVKVGDMRRDGSDGDLSITLYEKHGDIDFNEFESLSPEAINEIEEWNRQNPTLNIYDDDVEIENYKRVEK